MTVEYSESNMTISAAERANFYEIVATCGKRGIYPRKIFVSRLSRSAAQPNYRVLRNEAELATALEALGFTVIEPEAHPLEVQIGMFAAAEQVVFLGGSGVYNAVFCAPDSSVLTIESTDIYAGAHTEMFASLRLRHGVIFGQEDRTDPQPHHRRWTLDIGRAIAAIAAFFAAG
jgi:capsular polysaccharide biosynthesis protein